VKSAIAFVKTGCLYLVHLIMPAATRLHTVISLHMFDYAQLKSAYGEKSHTIRTKL